MPSVGAWKFSYVSGWKKAFDYKSKSSRLDCLSFNVINTLIYIAFSVFCQLCLSFSFAFIDDELFPTVLQILAQTFQIFLFFFLLGSLVSSISLYVRRLRDMGKKWWWVFWSFVPLLNIVFFIWLCVTPSRD